MSPEDLLLTIAEVSMAFAALTGIVGVVGSQSRPEVFRAQYFLTFAMVGFALQAALFAFLPFVIAAFGPSLDAAIRACSVVLTLALGAWTFYGWVQTQRARRTGMLVPRFVPELMSVTSLLFVLALLLGSFGLLGGRAAGFYSAAVFLQLAYSGYFFMRLVMSLRPET